MTSLDTAATMPLPVASVSATMTSEPVKVQSEDFENYMNMLVFLKDPKTKPIISKLNPKMCLTCWQIFSDREKKDHPQSGAGSGPDFVKHKITGTF